MENQISITELKIYLLDVPIFWTPKGQQGVTLSRSEAEYVSISEAIKEIRFIFYFLESLGASVRLPIVVRKCNNFLSNGT